MKILIAVKSEIIITSLASLLSTHIVHTCATGTEALIMLEEHQPDALIIDLTLPIIDGITILRKSHFRPRIILAITNLTTPSVIQAAAEAGVQALILIPCTIRCIIDHLNTLIEKAPSTES